MFLSSKTISIKSWSVLHDRHTCQVLWKSKSETARAPLIFAHNLVIGCPEKSEEQVLRVRFFPLFKQTKITNTERDKQYCFVLPSSFTINNPESITVSICKSTIPNKYPVPLFVYLKCILTHDSYANQDSERLNQYEKRSCRIYVIYGN